MFLHPGGWSVVTTFSAILSQTPARKLLGLMSRQSDVRVDCPSCEWRHLLAGLAGRSARSKRTVMTLHWQILGRMLSDVVTEEQRCGCHWLRTDNNGTDLSFANFTQRAFFVVGLSVLNPSVLNSLPGYLTFINYICFFFSILRFCVFFLHFFVYLGTIYIKNNK